MNWENDSKQEFLVFGGVSAEDMDQQENNDVDIDDHECGNIAAGISPSQRKIDDCGNAHLNVDDGARQSPDTPNTAVLVLGASEEATKNAVDIHDHECGNAAADASPSQRKTDDCGITHLTVDDDARQSPNTPNMAVPDALANACLGSLKVVIEIKDSDDDDDDDDDECIASGALNGKEATCDIAAAVDDIGHSSFSGIIESVKRKWFSEAGNGLNKNPVDGSDTDDDSSSSTSSLYPRINKRKTKKQKTKSDHHNILSLVEDGRRPVNNLEMITETSEKRRLEMKFSKREDQSKPSNTQDMPNDTQSGPSNTQGMSSGSQTRSTSQSTQRRGRNGTQLRDLTLSCNSGGKIPIQFDKYWRLVGPNKEKYTSYVALLPRSKPSILIPKWAYEPKRVKDQIWDTIKLTYDVPHNEALKKRTLSYCATRWRSFKTQLTHFFIHIEVKDAKKGNRVGER